VSNGLSWVFSYWSGRTPNFTPVTSSLWYTRNNMMNMLSSPTNVPCMHLLFYLILFVCTTTTTIPSLLLSLSLMELLSTKNKLYVTDLLTGYSLIGSAPPLGLLWGIWGIAHFSSLLTDKWSFLDSQFLIILLSQGFHLFLLAVLGHESICVVKLVIGLSGGPPAFPSPFIFLYMSIEKKWFKQQKVCISHFQSKWVSR